MKRLLLPILFCIALFTNTAAIRAQLHLLAPNGGEKFKVGSSAVIRWEGVAATDVVTLEYSTNSGATWNLITSSATGLQYTWTPIPNTVSNACVMRVSMQSSTNAKIFLADDPMQPRLTQNAEFSPDGKNVIASGNDGYVYIWDVASEQVIHAFQTETGAGIARSPYNFWVTYSPDGKQFAVMSPLPGDPQAGNKVRIFDANTGALIRAWDHPSQQGAGYTFGMCRYSPDGTKLACTGRDSIYVFDVATGSKLTSLGGHCLVTSTFSGCNLPVSFDWSKDGSRIISGAAFYDLNIPAFVLSDPTQSTPVKTYPLVTKVPFFSLTESVAFSPDGSKFVSVTDDTLVRVWDTQSGAILLTFKPNTREADWAVFSPDGNSIMTKGSDHLGLDAYELKEWSVTDASFIRTVGADGGIPTSIAYSPDGTKAVAAAVIGAIVFQRPQASSASDTSDKEWAIIANNGTTIIVSAPRVQAHMNDMISIPISIDDPNGARANGVTKVDFSLRYNVSMLEPIGTTPTGIVSSTDRTLTFSLPLPTTDSVLTTLTFRAALGNDSVTALDLFNLSTDAPTVTGLEVDGEFKLLDLCRQGGARLLNPNGEVKLSVTPPISTDGNIAVDMNLLEDGKTRAYLVDFSGKRVRTLLDNDTKHGAYHFELDRSQLPSGRYFVILQTPTLRKTANLEVIR